MPLVRRGAAAVAVQVFPGGSERPAAGGPAGRSRLEVRAPGDDLRGEEFGIRRADDHELPGSSLPEGDADPFTLPVSADPAHPVDPGDRGVEDRAGPEGPVDDHSGFRDLAACPREGQFEGGDDDSGDKHDQQATCVRTVEE